jgi:hypothetical protein
MDKTSPLTFSDLNKFAGYLEKTTVKDFFEITRKIIELNKTNSKYQEDKNYQKNILPKVREFQKILIEKKDQITKIKTVVDEKLKNNPEEEDKEFLILIQKITKKSLSLFRNLNILITEIESFPAHIEKTRKKIKKWNVRQICLFLIFATLSTTLSSIFLTSIFIALTIVINVIYGIISLGSYSILDHYSKDQKQDTLENLCEYWQKTLSEHLKEFQKDVLQKFIQKLPLTKSNTLPDKGWNIYFNGKWETYTTEQKT